MNIKELCQVVIVKLQNGIIKFNNQTYSVVATTQETAGFSKTRGLSAHCEWYLSQPLQSEAEREALTQTPRSA